MTLILPRTPELAHVLATCSFDDVLHLDVVQLDLRTDRWRLPCMPPIVTDRRAGTGRHNGAASGDAPQAWAREA